MAGRRKLADGGDPDAIEFTGSELDDMMEGKSMPSQIPARFKRENAAAGAEDLLRSKGKSQGAAEDAATVMRGHAYAENPVTGGMKKTWDEKSSDPTKTKYPGDPGYSAGGTPKKKKKAGGAVEGAQKRPRLDRAGGGRNWIKGAITHPGALHRELHVPQGEKIPEAKIARAAHSDNPTLARRAHLAQTLKKMRG